MLTRTRCPADATALIEGGVGVYVAGSATVTNFGTISGGENSVVLKSASDLLIAEAGAQFVGAITGGGGTFELSHGSGAISGLGGTGELSGTDAATLGDFGSYIIGAGGTWTLAGFNAIASGKCLTVDGKVTVVGRLSLAHSDAALNVGEGGIVTLTGPAQALSGTVTGAGTVDFSGGTVTFNEADLAVATLVISDETVTLKGAIALTDLVTLINSTVTICAGGSSLMGGGTLALGVGASNIITGLSVADTLQNFETISGAGMLGDGHMVLINRDTGIIDGDATRNLIIDTGTNQIANAGLIEATGAGGVTIESQVLSSGVLEAAGGTLTAEGAVRGPGSALIAAGALVFNAGFSQNVAFIGTSGVLHLAQSRTYTGAISGFSLTGGTSLDLGDIGFVSANEATFTGTTTGGVLTVTDGTHTARITLTGNYTASSFVASSDGHGGVTIVDPPAAGGAAAVHRFVAAAAELGGGDVAEVSLGSDAWRGAAQMLARPAVA